MCTFVTDKNYFPPFVESEISLPSITVSIQSNQHIYQEYFINRIKILTPMHQYTVSNTIPYNMKWDSKKGAARGNILGKNFSVCTQYLHLKMVSDTETHNTVLSYSQQPATGHPILIQMSKVHILAPYFLGTDMQEKNFTSRQLQ